MAEVIGELKKEGLFYGDKVRVKKENAEGGDVAVSEDEAPKKRDKKEKSKKDEKPAKKEEKKKEAEAYEHEYQWQISREISRDVFESEHAYSNRLSTHHEEHLYDNNEDSEE